MQIWMVWTTTPITPISLREFTQAFGGSSGETVDEAIIEHSDARVYISRADVSDQENVLRADVEYATEQMGASPASMLSMRIGHGSGSLLLAEDISSKAIQRWGGFLDRNEP